MEKLKEYAADYGLLLTNEMQAAFIQYQTLLLEWNQNVNLTAITDTQEIMVKHFLDSLLLLDAVEIEQGGRLIDVGTGAGFPGIPVKIVRPDVKLTLLDSLNKRVLFLQAVSNALGQNNICVHARAEETARQPQYREQYAVATARAVAALPALAEYCLPFVRVGGLFAAMKGIEVEEETKQAEKAIALLGGQVAGIRRYQLPNGHARAVVLIKKISQTSTKYPRSAGKVTKSPL